MSTKSTIVCGHIGRKHFHVYADIEDKSWGLGRCVHIEINGDEITIPLVIWELIRPHTHRMLQDRLGLVKASNKQLAEMVAKGIGIPWYVHKVTKAARRRALTDLKADRAELRKIVYQVQRMTAKDWSTQDLFRMGKTRWSFYHN